jgi:hypothetical protein
VHDLARRGERLGLQRFRRTLSLILGVIDEDDLVLAAAGLGDVGFGEDLREDAVGAGGFERERAAARGAAGEREEKQEGDGE